MPEPICIGWKEWLDFPGWGLRRVRAKVDTGAYTSALDVAGYELDESATGPVARLRLALHRRRPGRVVLVETPVVRMTVVRSSAGICERRPVVEAEVRLGPMCERIQLTVTNRAGMRCAVLLGRRALAGRFLVDVSRKYLLSAKRSLS